MHRQLFKITISRHNHLKGKGFQVLVISIEKMASKYEIAVTIITNNLNLHILILALLNFS